MHEATSTWFQLIPVWCSGGLLSHLELRQQAFVFQTNSMEYTTPGKERINNAQFFHSFNNLIF
jgi:hypothetical protein